MRFIISVLTLSSFASTSFAQEPRLNIPIECSLGDTCYIQNFVDKDPSSNVADFACGPLSYDQHKGTDFALPTTAQMWEGVNVLAAASGTVTAVRDGMVDHIQGVDAAPDVSGVECGNGVVIDHGDGWTSQYCHLMNGSVTVERGQHVDAKTPLGHVGISGMTEFPHVHMALRKDDRVVDPFNPSGATSCTQTSGVTLWDDTMYYQSTGMLSVGITAGLPEYDAVRAGTATWTACQRIALLWLFMASHLEAKKVTL